MSIPLTVRGGNFFWSAWTGTGQVAKKSCILVFRIPIFLKSGDFQIKSNELPEFFNKAKLIDVYFANFTKHWTRTFCNGKSGYRTKFVLLEFWPRRITNLGLHRIRIKVRAEKNSNRTKSRTFFLSNIFPQFFFEFT